jgi:hypothetical protein
MKIQLDKKFRIENDTYSFVLISEEVKEREKLDQDRKKTGEKETYIHEEKWYFGKLSQCLERYLKEVTINSYTVSALLAKLQEIETKINEINVTFNPKK